MTTNPTSDDGADIVCEFVTECHEGLDQLDRDLVQLEQSGNDPELLARIFRCVHTIKGTCGFLGFEKLESVTHVGENLLVQLREGRIGASAEITTALLALVDAVRAILRQIEADGSEGAGDHGALIAQLESLATTSAEVRPLGALLVERGAVDAADVTAALQEQEAERASTGGDARIGEILVARGSTTPDRVHAALDAQAEARAASVAESSIRVDVPLLDHLMNLVGELVLTRNQILQRFASGGEMTLGGPAQRLDLITTELQQSVMKTRMQPIGHVWNKLPRVVRDLANLCGKQVSLDVDGADTELDKTIIEAIKDPLTHIVRNAVDHGIETPAERLAAGKPAGGRLSLRAFHEGGMVNIEIRDDGQGIDTALVRTKAIEKGVLSPEAALRLSEREALNLIFAPGFSTAPRVTNVSGRGVGMDVVKTNLERIGGTVDVSSIKGHGTTLRIKIPLTLAIIPGLVITTGGHRYAIPQVSLLELVRLDGAEARQRVEHVYGAPVYRLRGQLLPLVHLGAALGVVPSPWTLPEREAMHIVVLQAEGTSFGLVVDAINDTEEIVVKPLSRQLKGIPAFAGATIMGDGHVALILDVLGLAHQQHVIRREAEIATRDADTREEQVRTRTQPLLVFAVGEQHRAAVPLDAVARLEEFPREAVERTGRREVVQYRGRILPLVRLASLLIDGGHRGADGALLPVIVYTHEGQDIGFVVDRIIDIVDADLPSDHDRRLPTGSAIVQGRVTELLDPDRLVRLLHAGTEVAHAA